MSSKIVVKFILVSDATMTYEESKVLQTATIKEETNEGNYYFAWSDDDWSKLSHEDLCSLHEWMDVESNKDVTDIPFQYVCLVNDDTYLTSAGNPYYGIKVQFTEE
jgi:hypothetical protein